MEKFPDISMMPGLAASLPLVSLMFRQEEGGGERELQLLSGVELFSRLLWWMVMSGSEGSGVRGGEVASSGSCSLGTGVGFSLSHLRGALHGLFLPHSCLFSVRGPSLSLEVARRRG